MTDKTRQQHDSPRRPLTIAASLRTPSLIHIERFRGADLLGQALDALDRNAGDLGSPLRRLFHLVVALSHDVGVVGHVFAFIGFGHRLLVVTHTVGVQEVQIDQLVLDEVMGDTGNESGIGAGIDGEPLIGMSHDGVVHAVIDHIDLRTRTLAQMHPVIMRGQSTLPRLSGAGPENEHKLGIFSRLERTSTGLLRSVHVRSDAGYLRRGIAVVVIQIATHQIQEAIERP